MELSFDRNQMLKAVNTAKNFAETPSGLKVLQHAFMSAGFGHARLTTTDLGLWCQVELNARTPQPGTVTVPVRTLGKVLKALSQSRVSLHKEGDDVRLVAGPSEVRVTGMESDDYPEISPPQGRLLSMPINAALVDKVAYAVSKDETRYTLTGVYVEVGAGGLKLLATNGHRLARYTAASLPPGSILDADLSEPVTGIVPVRLLNEGVRLGSRLGGSVALELYEKAACIRVNGSTMLWANLIEGQYPDCANAIPAEYSGCVTISKGALGSAVSRLLALSKGRRVPHACLILDDGDMVLRLDENAGDGLSASERLTPSAIEGIVPVCGFNVRYLSEALERLADAARVQLKFSDEAGKSPVAVESPGCAGLFALMMPVKV